MNNKRRDIEIPTPVPPATFIDPNPQPELTESQRAAKEALLGECDAMNIRLKEAGYIEEHATYAPLLFAQLSHSHPVQIPSQDQEPSGKLGGLA